MPQRTYDNSAQANKDKSATYSNWLNDLGVKKRFQDVIWLPLVDLKKIVDFYIEKKPLLGHEPTATDYLFNILSRISDTTQRTAIHQMFQANFMAQDSSAAPAIDSIYQMKDPATGKVKVEILGKNFTVASAVTYAVGTNPAKTATIFGCSRNRLLVTIDAAPTGSPGTIDVRTKPGLSDSKTFTYE